MNKRGISPLVSTIVLIFLAIGIGVVVMNWGRAQLEASSKCAIETGMSIVKLNNIPQVCYSGSGESGFIKFIVENGANADIDAVRLRTIGSDEIYMLEVPDSSIEKGYTLQKVVPYNFDIFGKIKQVRLTPKIIVYPEKPGLICAEQAIIVNNVKEC